MRQLPAEWEKLATRKGIPPSARGIATATGLATTTITRLIFEGRTSPKTLRMVADSLGVTQDEIARLARISGGHDLGPWDPPRDAHLLDGPTREALDGLIRAIVKGGRDARSADEQKIGGARSPWKCATAPIAGAGGSSARRASRGEGRRSRGR
ncbi:MAG: hypothetical protein HZY73_11115 [Micropruina sp.]|nr:MAG: hypothetical protein HZY73_11115 [Micropruina sp.]